MWQIASEQTEKGAGTQNTKPPASGKKPAPEVHGENRMLWVQILLCALILVAAAAARQLALPVYRSWRQFYTSAMEQKETGFLGEERDLSRFAQQSLAQLLQQAGEALATGSASAETAQPASAEGLVRTRRGRGEAAPAGASLECYRPGFAAVPPLAGAVSLNSAYGWRSDPINGERAFHTGADLTADQGSAVLAVGDGVVRAAAYHTSYGNYVRVLHTGGDETLYAHLQYLFVRTGQAVCAGERLGTAGGTGNVTGVHLHFELFHQGVRYDPSALLGL